MSTQTYQDICAKIAHDVSNSIKHNPKLDTNMIGEILRNGLLKSENLLCQVSLPVSSKHKQKLISTKPQNWGQLWTSKEHGCKQFFNTEFNQFCQNHPEHKGFAAHIRYKETIVNTPQYQSWIKYCQDKGVAPDAPNKITPSQPRSRSIIKSSKIKVDPGKKSRSVKSEELESSGIKLKTPISKTSNIIEFSQIHEKTDIPCVEIGGDIDYLGDDIDDEYDAL